MSWDFGRTVNVAIYDTISGVIKRVTSCDVPHVFQQLGENEHFVELTERLDTSAWIVVDGVLTSIS